MTIASSAKVLSILAYKRRVRRKLIKKKFTALKHILKSKRYRILGRVRNKQRDREACILRMAEMNDAEFKRHYRLDRPTFDWLLALIKDAITTDIKQAKCSSGQPVQPRIKLAAALRFLAGGIYLDIAFGYGLYYKHVITYVWQVLEAI